MSQYDFLFRLRELGLEAMFYEDGFISIGKREFANPMFYFDGNKRGKLYDGNITFKAINRSLFGINQVILAIDLANEYLNSEG